MGGTASKEGGEPQERRKSQDEEKVSTKEEERRRGIGKDVIKLSRVSGYKLNFSDNLTWGAERSAIRELKSARNVGADGRRTRTGKEPARLVLRQA